MLGKTTAQRERHYTFNIYKAMFSVAALTLGLGLALAGANASSSMVGGLNGQNHPTTRPLVPLNDSYQFLQPGSTSGNCPAPSSGGTTTVGCRFVLDLMVNAGSSVYPDGVSAQQSYMTYTYQFIQNARVPSISTSCVPTSTVTYDGVVFDAMLQNEICNGPGSCTFRGTTVGPGSFAYASGAFDNGHCGDSPNISGGCPNPSQPPPWNQPIVRVAQVGLCAMAPGLAVLHWQFSPPAPPDRDCEIVVADGSLVQDHALYTDYVINIVNPTSTPTSTPTVAPTRTPAGNAFNFLGPGSTSGNCPAPLNGGTTTVGCRFVLNLMVNAGNSIAPNGTTGQQSYMTYTYQLIQNARVSSIASSCVPTSVVQSDLSVYDANVQNEVCNGPNPCTFRNVTVDPGSFAYASIAPNNCPNGCPDPNEPPPQNQQIFRVAQVGLCAVAPGQAVFHWQFAPEPYLRDTEIINVSGDIVNDPLLYTDYVINIVAPTNTPTSTTTPTATPNPNCEYQITQSTGASIVPGTLDIGNHGAEAITSINLPFAVRLYGVGYNSANVTSSGKLHFSSYNGPEANACLPHGSLIDTILPYWDDLRTDTTNAGCSIYASGCGVFTSVSGTAPNRAFNIEWRTVYNNQRTQSANFELRLYEGEDHFDIIYGRVDQGGSSATVGVQRDVASNFTQFECNTGGSITQGLQLTFNQSPCSATPTAVPTRTPSGNAFNFLGPSSTSGNCPAPLNGGTTTVGCRFVLDLMVNAGSSVAPNGLTAQQNYMTYTYQLIQVARVSSIGTSCVPTNTITHDGTVFDALMQNEICNGPNPCTFRSVTVGPGSLANASAALSNCPSGCPDPNQPPPQNQPIFRVARVGICAIAPGQARFHWQFWPPAPPERDTEIVNISGDLVNDPLLYTDYIINIVTPTNTPTPTPTRTPGILGHGTWEGRQPQPDPSQMLPISLTLRLTTGGPYYDYPLQTTDASGLFTVSVAGLPNGTYNWRAKGPQFLANSGTITLAGGPVTNLEAGLLRTGDANGDNIINVTDFNVLRATFGRGCGEGGYDGRADFNGDCTVNILDFNLMKRNFGFSGAVQLNPRGP